MEYFITIIKMDIAKFLVTYIILRAMENQIIAASNFGGKFSSRKRINKSLSVI